MKYLLLVIKKREVEVYRATTRKRFQEFCVDRYNAENSRLTWMETTYKAFPGDIEVYAAPGDGIAEIFRKSIQAQYMEIHVPTLLESVEL